MEVSHKEGVHRMTTAEGNNGYAIHDIISVPSYQWYIYVIKEILLMITGLQINQ